MSYGFKFMHIKLEFLAGGKQNIQFEIHRAYDRHCIYKSQLTRYAIYLKVEEAIE